MQASHDIFLSAAFHPGSDAAISHAGKLAKRLRLHAVRADRSLVQAEPVIGEIHRLLRGCRLVIADVTENNPNVMHEVGLAQAMGKPIVLLSQDPEKAAFNLRHLRILHYHPQKLDELDEPLSRAISETTTPSEDLRAMLVPASLGRPSSDSWFVVAASPLSYRRARGTQGGFTKLRRTSSDYVGIRGIHRGFGLLFGFDALPDNLDPDDCDDCVLAERTNLYCIASPKANRWTAKLLAKLAEKWSPRLEFCADPNHGDLRNIKVSILANGRPLAPSGWRRSDENDRYARDFGIVVRAPNPFHPNLMVAVIAGRSNLGTEAACTAFTEPKSLKSIRRKLQSLKIDIEDHKQGFWLLVSMRRNTDDEKDEADRSTLRIHRVEALVRRH